MKELLRTLQGWGQGEIMATLLVLGIVWVVLLTALMRLGRKPDGEEQEEEEEKVRNPPPPTPPPALVGRPNVKLTSGPPSELQEMKTKLQDILSVLKKSGLQ